VPCTGRLRLVRCFHHTSRPSDLPRRRCCRSRKPLRYCRGRFVGSLLPSAYSLPRLRACKLAWASVCVSAWETSASWQPPYWLLLRVMIRII
jgi:hypothetical protein